MDYNVITNLYLYSNKNIYLNVNDINESTERDYGIRKRIPIILLVFCIGVLLNLRHSLSESVHN